MGKYSCPECSGITGVVETRPSNGRLKRRRACKQGHRFTTVEIPHTAPKQIFELLKWLKLDPDLMDYAKHKISHMLLNTPLDEEEDE